MPNPKDSLDAYIDTVNRLEPEITPIDATAALASIAISLKRIADMVEGVNQGQSVLEKILAATLDVARAR